MARKGIGFILLTIVAALLSANVAAAKTVITFRHWGANAGIDGTWQKFNESQDEIEVQLVHVGFGEYVEKTLLEMAAGEGPDIFSLHDWNYAEMSKDDWAKNGRLLDLTPYWERDKHELNGDAWHPFLLEFGTRQGMLIGMPYGWSIGETINYNATLFDEMGVAYPDGSWTWDDLEAIARKMTRLDGQGIPEIIGIENAFSFEDWIAIEERIYGGGGTLFNESQTELTIGSSESRRVLERNARLASDVGHRNSGAWGEGRVAMRLAGLGRAIADKELFNNTWETGIAPGPKDPVTQTRYSGVGGVTLGVNPNTKNPEAVWEALKYFVQNYGPNAEATAGYVQFIPVTPDMQPLFFQQNPENIGRHLSETLLPTVNELIQTAQTPKPNVNPILDVRSADIGNILSGGWRSVARGQMELYEFIDNATRQVNAILQGL